MVAKCGKHGLQSSCTRIAEESCITQLCAEALKSVSSLSICILKSQECIRSAMCCTKPWTNKQWKHFEYLWVCICSKWPSWLSSDPAAYKQTSIQKKMKRIEKVWTGWSNWSKQRTTLQRIQNLSYKSAQNTNVQQIHQYTLIIR